MASQALIILIEYRTQGNVDVKKTLTNQTIRQYFFRQILAS